MYLRAILLKMQALRKAAKNLKVLTFPLVLTTLFKTAICCLVYSRRKYTKILLVVQYVIDACTTNRQVDMCC